MKKANYFFCIMICSVIATTSLHAQKVSRQDSTGLPGDNFSLQGALEMFKKAGSPEEFEKLINTQDNNVNNLDLNDDGDIDYVRVTDKMDKDNHVFILQVLVSETESQDIAVIELEKTGNASAILQIIGDEDIYGEQTIVEPNGGEGENANRSNNGNGPNYFGYSNDDNVPIVVNVWLWPCVRYTYRPGYVLWVSPWRWHRYPVWWHPWRPLAWHVFHPLRLHYHTGFVICHTHRVIHAHTIYTPFRTTSVIVRTRHSASVNHYRGTRTTTIRKGPGNIKVKTTRTKVKRGRG